MDTVECGAIPHAMGARSTTTKPTNQVSDQKPNHSRVLSNQLETKVDQTNSITASPQQRTLAERPVIRGWVTQFTRRPKVSFTHDARELTLLAASP
jgi:hypothetical protein